MSSTRRRHILRRAIALAAVAMLAGALFGTTAVATNALGAGDRFERLVDRIERFVAGPPPNRPTVPTITVTSPPTSPSPPAAMPPTSRAPSGEATPSPSPTPAPVRAPVDVDIVADHAAVFASQADKDWCAPAGVQIVLAVLGYADTSPAFQRSLAANIRSWESWEDSHNGGWGPAAIVEALAAHGAYGYEIRAYGSRAEALLGSAIAIEETGAPAVLLTWRGAHTWVMTGYRADADPTVFADATVSGAYILDPWYPRVSSIWGPSDPAGTFQDAAEMTRNFLPWKRPEGRYPDRDGKFIVVVPTIPRLAD